MKIEEILEKAAAFDELAQNVESGDDDLDSQADMILQKAAAFDEYLGKQADDQQYQYSQDEVDPEVQEVLEKAAAYDEYMLDVVSNDIIQKSAAYDELFDDSELMKAASAHNMDEVDVVIQKAAAYEDYVLDQMADEYLQKAAAYDELVGNQSQDQSEISEEQVQELMDKAAAYDKLAENFNKAASIKDKAVGAAKRFGQLLAGGDKSVRGRADMARAMRENPDLRRVYSDARTQTARQAEVAAARAPISTRTPADPVPSSAAQPKKLRRQIAEDISKGKSEARSVLAARLATAAGIGGTGYLGIHAARR